MTLPQPGRPTYALEPPPAAPIPPAQPASPRPSGQPIEAQFLIPTGYGDHQITVLVKDPWWLYAYWEIQPSRERGVRSQLAPEEVVGVQSILRVYDVTGRDFPRQPAASSFNIPLSGLATNWYIHVNAPDHAFIVDLGLQTRTGRFVTLVRSNRVTTPRVGPSDVIDEDWLTTDETYWTLFGVAAGAGAGGTSPGLKELLERKLFSPGVSSPGLFSPLKLAPPQGFHLAVNTELIIHGATDPKAAVTVQGQPITVRRDGTFSVRVALPDGTQTIPVEAKSPDHRDTQTVIPVVSRRTEGAAADRDPSRQAAAPRTIPSTS